MSYESVVEHMKRELVAGATRRRRRERIHRGVAAVVVAAAVVVGAVALTIDEEQATRVSTEPTQPTAEARAGARTEACNSYLDLTANAAVPGPSTTAALEQIAALATTSGDEVLARITATILDKYPKSKGETTSDERTRELGNAYRELIGRCREIGLPGLNPVYIAPAVGPEPRVELSAYGTEQRLESTDGQLPAGATAPQGRNLSPVVVAASAEGAYAMTWSYLPATASDRAYCRSLGTKTGSNSTCGPVNDPKSIPVTGISIRTAGGTTFRDAISIEVPHFVAFVVLETAEQRLVQRPVGGIIIFVWQPGSPPPADFTVRSYDADGRVLECVASGTSSC